MQMEKLFQVLVVGGALLGGQSISLGETENLNANFMERGALQGATGAEELSPIFCTTEEACPKDANGQPKVKAGFVCCWGTSCAKLPQPE